MCHFGLLFLFLSSFLLSNENSYQELCHKASRAYEFHNYHNAINYFLKALPYNTDSAELYYNLGICYKLIGDLSASQEYFIKALTINLRYAKAHFNYGLLLVELKNPKQALSEFKFAHDLEPQNPHFTMQLANRFGLMNHHEKALELYAQLLDYPLEPNMAYNNYAFSLMKLNRIDEAIEHYQKSIEIDPQTAKAQFGLAHAFLLQGNFSEGWEKYVWRWIANNDVKPDFQIPFWQGEPLEDKHLLIYTEQGLGDTFQFIRYALELKNQGAHITVVTNQEALNPLLSECWYIDTVILLHDQIPFCDYQIALLDIPGILKTTIDTIPHRDSYLTANQQLYEYWKTKIEDDHGFKVGICWQGSAEYKSEAMINEVKLKSIPLSLLAQLGDIPGVSLYSLQKINGLEQLDSLKHVSIHHFDSNFDRAHGRFMDTAALIMHLDLVITIDSSIAHLAPALGKETWILIPFCPNWRWLMNRTDSPWYNNVTLFRQPVFEDWVSVIEQIKQELKQKIGLQNEVP